MIPFALGESRGNAITVEDSVLASKFQRSEATIVYVKRVAEHHHGAALRVNSKVHLQPGEKCDVIHVLTTEDDRCCGNPEVKPLNI